MFKARCRDYDIRVKARLAMLGETVADRAPVEKVIGPAEKSGTKFGPFR